MFTVLAEKMVKIVRSDLDMTPICSSATLRMITLIVCKIKTCRLLYEHGQDFVHQCDSRFKLTTKNQSVFLLLNRLTPEDSGNYTCECSHFHGTHSLHLQIQVEGTVKYILCCFTFVPRRVSVGFLQFGCTAA